MSGRSSALLLALATLGGPACHPSTSAPPLPSSDAPAEDGAAPSATSRLPPPELPEIDAGPLPASDPLATKEARERAVLELLAGGEPATRLPGAVVDPGAVFSPSQRERVAPSVKPPQLRQGKTTVTGSIPSAVIERLVRQNFGRVRLCYEKGLRDKPELAGKVVVNFVIDSTGAVTSATSRGSDFPDATVVECVRRGFEMLSFPAPPEKGVVNVTYPILLSPGG